MIKKNLETITQLIEKTCQNSNRNPKDVTLIAVSKTKPIAMINEAYECGIRNFGENKVQELVEKYEQLPKDISWHMIGHLQRNKVKFIVDKVSLIHSVDSIRLAEKIDNEAKKKNCKVNILLEVNISGEKSKYGFLQEELEKAVPIIASFTHISVKGLMTVAPLTTNQENNRCYFSDLHKLSVDIRRKNADNISMNVLSMGMTKDYIIALEEGATLIRVGTGIFGARDYST